MEFSEIKVIDSGSERDVLDVLQKFNTKVGVR